VPKFTRISSNAIIGTMYEQLALSPKMDLVEALSGTPYPSNNASETYPWLGMVPQLREWVSGRHVKTLRQFYKELKNKKYEDTLDFELDDLNRDKTDQIMVRVREMVDQAGDPHWMKLLCDLILLGESTLCYDGQYFFDTTHEEGDSGSQSNLLSIDISGLPAKVHGSTAANPSVEEVSMCIMQGIQAMMGFHNDQGEPYNELARTFKIVASTTLMGPIESALTTQFFSSGDRNPVAQSTRFSISGEYSARLATLTDRFDIFRTDSRVKPMMRQLEYDVTPTRKAEGSDYEHDYDRWQFGVKKSCAADFALWQHACRIIMY